MSFLTQNLADNWEFTELWIDPTASPPYVLILLSDTDSRICIYDPTQNYQIVFSSGNYEQAKLWLLEDEYQRVEGRLTPAFLARKSDPTPHNRYPEKVLGIFDRLGLTH